MCRLAAWLIKEAESKQARELFPRACKVLIPTDPRAWLHWQTQVDGNGMISLKQSLRKMTLDCSGFQAVLQQPNAAITSHILLLRASGHSSGFVKHHQLRRSPGVSALLPSATNCKRNSPRTEQNDAVQTTLGAKWKCNLQAYVNRESPFLQEKKSKQPHGNTLISALAIRGDGCCRA